MTRGLFSCSQHFPDVLNFPQKVSVYCMCDVCRMCQLESPVLFRAGLLASHQFIQADLPLGMRYSPSNSLENGTCFCCPRVLGDCKDKAQVSPFSMHKMLMTSLFGLGIRDCVTDPVQSMNICRAMLSVMLLPCNVHSHMKVQFYQFFVIVYFRKCWRQRCRRLSVFPTISSLT